MAGRDIESIAIKVMIKYDRRSTAIDTLVRDCDTSTGSTLAVKVKTVKKNVAAIACLL
jgi:hypothetical protein